MVEPFDHDRLLATLGDVDVVVESSAPWPLDPVVHGLELETVAPRLVSVAVSPFGLSGPKARDCSTDLTDEAVSGHLLLNGDPDRAPLRGPAHLPALLAGIHAAIGAVAALVARHRTGRGQRVEVSHHEVMVALHQFTLLRYTHSGDILRRMGNRYAGPGTPIGAYRCRDGVVSLTVPRDDQLERLLAVAGLTHLLDEPGIGSTYDLMHHADLLERHLLPWLAEQDAEELVELLQAVRVPAGPVRTLAGLLDDPHLAARRFWRPLRTRPDLLTPGPPARHTTVEQRDANGAPAPVRFADDDLADGPLTGVRVLDLTRVWAGPLATRILADLGADVVMVEAPLARGPAEIDDSSVTATHYYPDDVAGEHHWNRIGFVNKYAVNKRSIALDLTTEAGRSALEEMVTRSDVLVENYSPRVMPQLGLGEERLRALNADLVYVTMPGFGRTGPASDRIAYGPMIDGHAGLSVVQGYPDDVARKGGIAWPDPVAGLHAAFATLVALHVRLVDRGRGATIEVAQLEATISVTGHAVIDRQLDGCEPVPIGSRDRCLAPQGVHPCRGEDGWIAVSVVDDSSWVALCEVAGLAPDWCGWDVGARRLHHDAIDAALGRWTSGGDATDRAARLRSAGVVAEPVADAAMVMADPHLAARRAFVTLDHPEAGAHPWPRLAVRLDGTPASYRRPAPCLGEHRREVLVSLAGYADAAVDELEAAGVVVDRPPS